jgi:hypothetical protein
VHYPAEGAPLIRSCTRKGQWLLQKGTGATVDADLEKYEEIEAATMKEAAN